MLEKIGVTVILREAVRKVGPVITEHGNLILDIRFGSSSMHSKLDPSFMETELNQIPGVIENGFFTKKAPIVYIARSDGTVEIRKKQ
jgi:ribose 5-phosphate isomerase A